MYCGLRAGEWGWGVVQREQLPLSPASQEDGSHRADRQQDGATLHSGPRPWCLC